jgi:hypothetical protein
MFMKIDICLFVNRWLCGSDAIYRTETHQTRTAGSRRHCGRVHGEASADRGLPLEGVVTCDLRVGTSERGVYLSIIFFCCLFIFFSFSLFLVFPSRTWTHASNHPSVHPLTACSLSFSRLLLVRFQQLTFSQPIKFFSHTNQLTVLLAAYF